MNARDAIMAEFMRQYAKKDVQRITVKGLCEAAPVARTTFYAYFNNTDEVCEQIENEIIGGLEAVTATVSKGNLPDMGFDLFMDAVEASRMLTTGGLFHGQYQNSCIPHRRGLRRA